MGTFLATAKMSPELAARVEASVRGRPGSGKMPSLRAKRLARFARRALALAAAAGIVALLVGALRDRARERRREQQALADARTALMAAAQRNAHRLTPTELTFVRRAKATLVRLGGEYPGDLVPDPIRGPRALDAVLARPAVYVRGPSVSFATPAKIAEVAVESTRDALLYCLLDPPPTRSEKALLARAKGALEGRATAEERMANVRRLDDAERGLPYFLPSWGDRVTPSLQAIEVSALQRELDAAPLAGAEQAVKAQLLIVAMDEPAAAGVTTELDGERPHDVRVMLTELDADEPLLRLRLHVDPGGLSDAVRGGYASGVDSCALALDVRARVTGAPGAGAKKK